MWVQFFRAAFASAQVQGTLVFDARKSPQTQHQYERALRVIYATGCADQHILEILIGQKAPANYTVVTDDRSLALQSRALKAHTLSIDAFLNYLKQRASKKNRLQEKPGEDSRHDMERLLREWEDHD